MTLAANIFGVVCVVLFLLFDVWTLNAPWNTQP